MKQLLYVLVILCKFATKLKKYEDWNFENVVVVCHLDDRHNDGVLSGSGGGD